MFKEKYPLGIENSEKLNLPTSFSFFTDEAIEDAEFFQPSVDLTQVGITIVMRGYCIVRKRYPSSPLLYSPRYHPLYEDLKHISGFEFGSWEKAYGIEVDGGSWGHDKFAYQAGFHVFHEKKTAIKFLELFFKSKIGETRTINNTKETMERLKSEYVIVEILGCVIKAQGLVGWDFKGYDKDCRPKFNTRTTVVRWRAIIRELYFNGRNKARTSEQKKKLKSIGVEVNNGDRIRRNKQT
jgi:hypothetical protein